MVKAVECEAKIVHILSKIFARFDEELRGSLIDDKPASVISDTSKIKRFVPGFTAVMLFHRGIRRTLEWFESDPARNSND